MKAKKGSALPRRPHPEIVFPKSALADLCTVFAEPLDAPISMERPGEDELRAVEESYRRRGERLADDIFELAHKKRCTDLQAYLKTINDAALNKPSVDNQMVLITARSHFRTAHGRYLREHGLSVDMLDQIVHRTGKQSTPEVKTALDGFDAKAMARRAWELHMAKDFIGMQAMKQAICGLTDMYVRELRAEYNLIPLQEAAKAIHAALFETNLQGEPQPNADEVRYVLLGRTIHEVRQIEFQFNELYHYVRGREPEKTLRQQIHERFEGEKLKTVETLLEGFNSAHVAHQIHRLLSRCGEISEAVEEHLQIHPDFSGSFRRRYGSRPCWEKELRARDAINSLLRALTPQQFKNVNVQLKKLYNSELTPELYTCNRPFNPRRIALQLYQSFAATDPRRNFAKDQEYLSHSELVEVKQRFHMCTTREITELIRMRAGEVKAQECRRLVHQALQPLEYLSPSQLYHVKEQFRITSGIELEQYIQERAAAICLNNVAKYAAQLIESRLSGTARLRLNADLAEIFACPELPAGAVPHGSVLSKAYQDGQAAAAALDHLLSDKEQSTGKKTKKIFELLRAHTRGQLTAIETAYLDGSTSKRPLAQDLARQLSPERFGECTLVLCGFDPRACAKRIGQSLDEIFTLLLEPPDAVALTAKYYQQEYNTELSAAVKKAYRGEANARKRVLALSVLYTPVTAKLKSMLSVNKRLDERHLDMLIRQLRRPYLEILAYEAAYNRHFARFEYCCQKHSGSLLQRLRVMATLNQLPREAFARAILLLEALDQDIAANLHAMLAQREISREGLSEVQALLRQHRQDLRTIAKAYNAINEELTLRETIYELRIPLDIINKTLLLLDGFDPDRVAAEIHDRVERDRGGALGGAVMAILQDPRQGAPNPRIPKDPNWTEEMYHQIRLSYETLCGENLLCAMMRREVPRKGAGINAAAYKFYGELSKSTVDLHRLLTAAADRNAAENQAAVLIEKIIPALRERLISMYNAYFAAAPAELKLAEAIKRNFRDAALKAKALKLLDEARTWEAARLAAPAAAEPAADQEKEAAAAL